MAAQSERLEDGRARGWCELCGQDLTGPHILVNNWVTVHNLNHYLNGEAEQE